MFGSCTQLNESPVETHATFYVDMDPTPLPQGIQAKPVKGWLGKKGGMMKSWHQRWFVLTDKMLFQFNREDDIRQQGSYLLADSNYRVVEQPFNPDESDKFCFDLIPGPRTETGTGETLMLCAANAEDRKRWIKALRYALFAEKGGAIFGQPLEDTMCYNHQHGRTIPIIIEKCVEFLYANGLEVEGVFRLPGRTALVRELKEKFDCGETDAIEKLEPDVNSVASLLKMYLRELPESIIPCKLYQRYMNYSLRFIDAKDEEKKHKCVLQLADAMSDLPKDNYTILKYLIKFLYDVGKHSQVNKMTVENLATVFGPNIIRHMDDNPELFMVTADLTQQLAFMLINYHDIVFTFDYRDDGNVPCADLLRMSTMDSNPVLTPQFAVQPPAVIDQLESLNLQFADEVFDQLSQCSGQSPLLPPDSPLCFTDNHFPRDSSENTTQSADHPVQDDGSLTNSEISRPIPPKRRSRIARGRRISDRRSGSHGDSERVKTPDDPSKTLTDSIREALAQKSDSGPVQTNGTAVNSIESNDISRSHDMDSRVEPSVAHLKMQNEALKLELVNTKTRYDATVKALQKEIITLKGQYENRISAMEGMITSQNSCLKKEKKDRAEAVERVVNLQAQLHQYQMQYGELRK